MKEHILAILTFSSLKTSLLVGKQIKDKFYVLAVNEMKTEGYRDFEVFDTDLLSETISTLVDKTSQLLGMKISGVQIVLPNHEAHLTYIESEKKILNLEEEIRYDDVMRAIKSGLVMFKKNVDNAYIQKYELVNVFPVLYESEICNAQRNIEKMVGKNLMVRFLVTNISKKKAYPYFISVEKAGLKIKDVSIQALPLFTEVQDTCKNKLVVNFSDDIQIFYANEIEIEKVASFEYGIKEFVTRLISKYNITEEVALLLINQYKYLDPSKFLENELIEYEYNNENYVINLKDYVQTLKETLIECLEALKQELTNNNTKVNDVLFTGSIVEFEDFYSVAKNVFTYVQIYNVDQIGIKDSKYIVCLGYAKMLDELNKVFQSDISSVSENEYYNFVTPKKIEQTKSKINLKHFFENR